MTPGEAAVRNASSALTCPRAAFRLSVSTCAARASRTVIGPVQAGVFRRERPGSPNTRPALPGEATRARYWGGWLLAPEPVRGAFVLGGGRRLLEPPVVGDVISA